MEITPCQAHERGLEATLEVIGGKWKPLILRILYREPRRFGELRREMARVSEKVLAQQLRELEADGIVDRRDFGEMPPRVEYAISPFGLSLAEALGPLCEWGTRNLERIADRKLRAV